MKKLVILFLFLFGMLNTASADTLNYKIKQEGSTMVIVPSFYTPPKPLLYTPPAKIPFYSGKKLPKGMNKNRMA